MAFSPLAGPSRSGCKHAGRVLRLGLHRRRRHRTRSVDKRKNSGSITGCGQPSSWLSYRSEKYPGRFQTRIGFISGSAAHLINLSLLERKARGHL